MIFPVAAVLLVVAYHPPAFFLAVAVLYIFSAPTLWLRGRWFPQPARQRMPAHVHEAGVREEGQERAHAVPRHRAVGIRAHDVETHRYPAGTSATTR